MRLVDESGHIWLEFGESNYDDCYPCFEWHYYAKAPVDAAKTGAQ